jgi:hypothetical protein
VQNTTNAVTRGVTCSSWANLVRFFARGIENCF